MQSLLLARAHPGRDRTEELVRTVYAQTYDARIASFPDLMAAVVNDAGEPLCAAGLRTADSGYFSECYLDSPVEASIAAAAREPVARGQVLEVTTLASLRCTLSPALVRFIIEYASSQNIRWGLFTVTERLRRALGRGGLVLHPLAPALASRVPDAVAWGSYYDTTPWVCAVANPLCARVPRAGRSRAAAPRGSREAAAVA